MATSPDYLRLVANATHALADTALDSLRDAVLVVDARHRHVPLVLANETARHYLTGESGFIETPLARLLGASSAAKIDIILASLADPRTPTNRVLAWRFALGEQSVMTDIKPLVSAAGQ